MELVHRISYRKVIVFNSTKFGIDLPRHWLFHKKCHTYRGYNNCMLAHFRAKKKYSTSCFCLKCVYDINSISLGKLDASTLRNNERNGELRFQVDRPRTKTISSLCKHREVNEWNNLLLNTRSLS